MNWKTGTGSPRVGQAIAVCATLVAVQFAVADTAVDIVSNDPSTNVFPAGGTTFGWQFSVNETIEITHIGLYDNNSDGFDGEHPIGLWDEEGSLIWSDVIEAGSSLPLVDLFRYIDLDPPTLSGTDGTITVAPGQKYTIGFFSADFLLFEGMLTRFGEEVLIDDVITTGATASACAMSLRAAGYKSVSVFSLATPLVEQ